MDSDALELDLDVADEVEAVPGADDFRCWVAAALDGLRETAEVSIRVVGEAEGRTLNHRYRGRDYATNVLSFPAELPPEVALPLLGDLAICAPVVAQEAREQGKAWRAHWAHMTVHGVLHLLSYDHEGPEEAAVMEGREQSVLAGLGYPDPYVINGQASG